jgi:hypothetical protein
LSGSLSLPVLVIPFINFERKILVHNVVHIPSSGWSETEHGAGEAEPTLEMASQRLQDIFRRLT